MASLFQAPAFRTVLRRSISAPAARNEPTLGATTATAIRMPQLWRESLQLFSAHGGWVLFAVFFGLSSPFLVGCWIATQAVLQDMAWVGPVPTLQEKLSPAMLAVLGMVSWSTISFTRGFITAIAFQRDASRATRDAMSHLPALLVSSFVYSALIAGCLLGASPIVRQDPVLSQDSTAPIWTDGITALGEISHHMAGEVFPAMLPDAGAPFADVVPAARAVLFQPPPRSEYERMLLTGTPDSFASAQKSSAKGLSDILPTTNQMIALVSLVMLICAETLLRFRIVLAIEPPEVMLASYVKPGGRRLRRFAALLPLVESMRFGLRHFGAVTLHILALRIAGGALMLLLVELPMMATWHLAAPALIAVTGKTPLLPLMYFAQISLATLVAGIVLAFSTIYDARLFKALSARRG